MTSVSRFTKIANNIWRHTFSRFLANIRAKMVAPYLKGDILDIGCGETMLTRFLKKGQRYFGVDIQGEVIQKLRQNMPSHEFYCIDIDTGEQTLVETVKSQFDAIVLLAVIEHLKNPQVVLSQCNSLLKPDGLLVITTPASKGDKLIRFIKRTLGVKDELEEGYGPHLINFNEQTLTGLLTAGNEFKVKFYKKFELGFNQLIVASK